MSKNAEYQRKYREKVAAQGRKEIRGIMATDAEEVVIKPVIKKMLVNLRKSQDKST